MSRGLQDLLLVCVALSASVVAGCGERTTISASDASAFRCTSTADCDDGADCTVDTCSAGGVCNYMPVDALCPTGQHCQVGAGCSAETFCNTPEMCDDDIDCTIDTCDVGNVCGHMPIDALCTDPVMNTCDRTTGCVAGATGTCASAADCDDDIDCTIDTCAVDRRCRHAAMDSLCTGPDQHCDLAQGCTERHRCDTAADCVQYYNFCDGDPTCDPEFGCQAPETPRMCNDGNRCSTDSCDPTAGDRGACAAVCDRVQTGCDGDPLCATVGPSCAGHFSISPAPMNHCIGGMVDYDVSSATFDIIGGMLIVTPPSAHFGNLTDASAPVCPTFTATARVDGAGAGGVTEIYTLTGTFSDDDHFTGTFTADLGGFGGFLGCTEGSMSVTGTRIP